MTHITNLDSYFKNISYNPFYDELNDKKMNY